MYSFHRPFIITGKDGSCGGSIEELPPDIFQMRPHLNCQPLLSFVQSQDSAGQTVLVGKSVQPFKRSFQLRMSDDRPMTPEVNNSVNSEHIQNHDNLHIYISLYTYNTLLRS
jgi:hypothetical protein